MRRSRAPSARSIRERGTQACTIAESRKPSTSAQPTSHAICPAFASPCPIRSRTCIPPEGTPGVTPYPRGKDGSVGDGLIILDGCTFFSTDEAGDAEAREAEGFFYQDVRHVSRWHLRVNGQPVEPLSSRRVDYYSARIVGVPGRNGDDPALSVRRDRFVTEGAHEDVVVENLTPEPQSVRVELTYGSDFADVMEAQDGGTNGDGRSGAETTAQTATLWKEREGYRRETVLTFSRHGNVTKDRAVFDLELGPREQLVALRRRDAGRRRDAPAAAASLRVLRQLRAEDADVARRVDGLRTRARGRRRRPAPHVPAEPARPRRAARPARRRVDPLGDAGRRRAVVHDRLRPRQPDRGVRVGPVPPGALAGDARRARRACRRRNGTTGATPSPGKILHELRRGTLAALGKIPHTPYYGSHDATMLFLILLDEYERWSGDRGLVRELEPNARAALAWLEGPADLDGDGYVEYRRRSSSDRALDNHCWKDSETSIVFADGSLAEPPIAVCEHQGYAYDARLRTARLAREVWGDEETAARLEADAAALKARFDRDFWIPVARPLRARARRRQAPGRLDDLEPGPPALERHRDRAAGAADRAAAARRGHVLRLGHPLAVLARGRLQPARVPQRHRLAARHRR